VTGDTSIEALDNERRRGIEGSRLSQLRHLGLKTKQPDNTRINGRTQHQAMALYGSRTVAS